MKAREIIPLGVWIASAIQVANYTWKAYFGSYVKFPGISGGGGGGDAGTTNAWSVGGFIENTLTAITHPGELISGLGDAISNVIP